MISALSGLLHFIRHVCLLKSRSNGGCLLNCMISNLTGLLAESFKSCKCDHVT
ncbi:hypothetical protein Hanom_Chr10g00964891 [Helianthus anomalus]